MDNLLTILGVNKRQQLARIKLKEPHPLCKKSEVWLFSMYMCKGHL